MSRNLVCLNIVLEPKGSIWRFVLGTANCKFGYSFWISFLEWTASIWVFYFLFIFNFLLVDLQHIINLTHVLLYSGGTASGASFSLLFLPLKKKKIHSLLLEIFFFFTRVLEWVSCIFHCKRVVAFGFSCFLFEGLLLDHSL